MPIFFFGPSPFFCHWYTQIHRYFLDNSFFSALIGHPVLLLIEVGWDANFFFGPSSFCCYRYAPIDHYFRTSLSFPKDIGHSILLLIEVGWDAHLFFWSLNFLLQHLFLLQQWFAFLSCFIWKWDGMPIFRLIWYFLDVINSWLILFHYRIALTALFKFHFHLTKYVTELKMKFLWNQHP